MSVDGISGTQRMPPAAAAQPPANTGRLGGGAVALLPPGQAVDLTDAAEELGMGHATLRERSLRELKPQVQPALVLPSEEELDQLWRAVGDSEAASLEVQANQLLDAARDRLPLLQEVARRASDPSRQHLLLAAAWRLARARGGAYGPAAELLADALEQLEEESGPLVRAGFNTARQAQAFARTVVGQDAFRAAYRDAVLFAESMPKMFKLVLQRFGSDRFEEGVGLLLAALASDLAALRPSLEPVRLNAIFSDLYLLQACSSVLDSAKQARRRMRPSVRVGDTRLAEAVVDACTDSTTSAWNFQSLLSGFGIHEEDAARMFLAEVLGMLRAMPTKLFNSPEHRLHVIDAAQQAVDAHTAPRPSDA